MINSVLKEAILALDIGLRRVGVAIRRSSVNVVLPLGSFQRAQGEAERAILKLIAEEKITCIVAGLPLDEIGQPTSMSRAVQTFCRRIQRRSNVVVNYFDEFGSSIEAADRLAASMHNKRMRNAREKGVVDATAAAIILEQFLADCERSENSA